VQRVAHVAPLGSGVDDAHDLTNRPFRLRFDQCPSYPVFPVEPEATQIHRFDPNSGS